MLEEEGAQIVKPRAWQRRPLIQQAADTVLLTNSIRWQQRRSEP